jgi:hypothetical protein
MRMRPIFSSNSGQSRTKKLDEDWHEQFFKLNVTHIFDQQVTITSLLSVDKFFVLMSNVDANTTACVASISIHSDPKDGRFFGEFKYFSYPVNKLMHTLYSDGRNIIN